MAGTEETTTGQETPLPEVKGDGFSSYKDLGNPEEWTVKKNERRGQDKGKAPQGKAPQSIYKDSG